jgi:hypothetical protein
MKKHILLACALATAATIASAQTDKLFGVGATFNTQVAYYESSSYNVNSFGLSADSYVGGNFGFYSGGNISILTGCAVTDSSSGSDVTTSLSVGSLNPKMSFGALAGFAGKFTYRPFTFLAGAGLGLDSFFYLGTNTATKFFGLYLGPGIVLLAQYDFADKMSAYFSFRGNYDIVAIAGATNFDSCFSFTPTIGLMFR